MARSRLILAVRDRMRRQTAARDRDAVSTPAPPPPVARRPQRPAPPDPQLEQLAAEAQYHRNRYELARARVISASPSATTPGRLHALQRSAVSAEERLAHARDGGQGDG